MRRGRDGFTLIEVLAAFVILAVVMVVVVRGVVAASTSIARAGDRVAAERVARTVLASPHPISFDAPTLSGEDDGRRWTMTAAALPFAPATVTTGNATATWAPARLTLKVALGGGRTLDVETVRLVRSPAP